VKIVNGLPFLYILKSFLACIAAPESNWSIAGPIMHVE